MQSKIKQVPGNKKKNGFKEIEFSKVCASGKKWYGIIENESY
jgi:hypothetical protein